MEIFYNNIEIIENNMINDFCFLRLWLNLFTQFRDIQRVNLYPLNTWSLKIRQS